MQSYERLRRHVHARPSPSRSAPTSTSRRCWCRTASRARCPRCPTAVQKQGVTVQKKSTSILSFVTLTSPDGRLRQPVSRATTPPSALKDEIARLPGVGSVTVFGAGQYSMRIWLDPEQAAGARPDGVRRRSAPCSSRASRSPPARSAGRRRSTARPSSTRIKVQGRLDEPPSSSTTIIVKTGGAGGVTRRARHRPRRARRAGRTARPSSSTASPPPASAMFQSPGANALDVADRGRDTDGGAGEGLPRRPALLDPVQHHQVRRWRRSTRSTRR